MDQACAHASCSCIVGEGQEYCSEACANVITVPVRKCRCMHDRCEGYLRYLKSPGDSD